MKTKLPFIVLGIALLAGVFFYSRSSTQTTSSLHEKLLAIENSIPTQAGKKNFLAQSANLTKSVDPELVDLDSQIISCDVNVEGMMNGMGMSGSCIDSSMIDPSKMQGKFMSGQCCSPMKDTEEYHEHLKKLQAYKDMPDVVLDPMHTPVELAKKWIDYDKTTNLTPSEQRIFDEAYAISKEKPCCCKCWHYYLNEGVAKKMIKDGTFGAQQIADYWDNSDICGA